MATLMQLEIIPGIGIGPVRRGMTSSQVLKVFPENQQYEDGCLGIMGKLELCFAESGELDWLVF